MCFLPGHWILEEHIKDGHWGENFVCLTKYQESAVTWFYLLKLALFMISQANSFRQMATFPLRDETHGGEDVSVYAVGPQV